MRLQFPATNDAPLPLEARRDVLATAVAVAGRNMWAVKDPLTLEQYELGEAEYLLLAAIGNGASLRTLQQAYQSRFAPCTITPAEIQSYLGRLHQAGLVVATSTGQGVALAERASERRSARLRWSWMELLAVRLPGIDPDRMLEGVHALLRPMFHPVAIMLAVLFVLSATILAVSHAAEFFQRLPEIATLLSPSNWLWLAVTVAMVKLLHELGHALVAKHFGAEVHELGIMLLVFMPTLYCDVTDIWKLPSKWQRMAVSAAGMGVEVLLAAGATFVWWFSEPGLLNLLALNTMVVASVGTLLVNANPLMRYDGYYLLADWCETPNLWQRSRDAWHGRAASLVMRRQPNAVREPLWLALYGGCSSAYMLLVLGTILWAAITALQPTGFGVLAYGLGGVMVASVITGPVRQTVQTVRNPVRRRDFRPISAFALLGLLTISGGLAWRMPVNDYVVCEANVVPAGGRAVVATMSGELQMTVPAGTAVQQGDTIARLTNSDIQLAGEQLAGELRLARLKLAQLETLRTRDAKASSQLPTAQAEVAEVERQLAEHQDESQRLTIRAPRAGVAFDPRNRRQSTETITLASWSGSPLERSNSKAWIEAGTIVAVVGDANRREIALAIDEADIELVAPGQMVRIQLSAVGSKPLAGTIIDIAHIGDNSRAGNQSGGSSELPTTRYEARVELDECPASVPIDSGGRAKIAVGQVSLGKWIVREARDTFRLP